MRTIFLASASAAAILATWLSAQAETTPAAGSGQIELVVVTAERRSENLMKTPIAADVLTGDDIKNKGVLTVDQLQFIAPSVAIDNFGQGIDFNIRGIGKGEHNSQTSTGVITYRDGVPTFPGYFTEEPYYDIANVEVLRGPQGTFVGQSATGGAVFVNSNSPEIGGGYDGYAMAGYGNYNDTQLQGAVNIPISDTFAARVSLFGDARSSFYSITDSDPADNCPNHKYAGCKPGYNPGDVRWGAGRISLLWKPTDALTVSFKTDVDFLDSGAYPSSPFTQGFPSDPHFSDVLHISANAPNFALDRFTRSVLKVDYVFPDGITLQSISGYQNGNTNFGTDLDATDTGNQTFFDKVDETIYSEEVNLISRDTGLVTWVLGAFAQDDQYYFGGPGFPGASNPYRFDVHFCSFYPACDYQLAGVSPYMSYAGFGQISLNLTNGLQFQVGTRYNYNRETNRAEFQQFGLLLPQHQVTASNNISYKASVNWTLNDDHFIYAFVSTGYKPGGLNVPVGLGIPAPFRDETVTSYETGWKATWLDGHLRTQLDAYYNDYNNFQVIIGYPAIPVFGFEVNDPKPTKIYGFEAETQAVFGNLSFSGGVGVMHSGLGQFFATDPRIASATPCDPATGPASPSCKNLRGHPTTYAPNFTFNLSAQYQFDLDGGDKLTPRVNFAHESSQWATLLDNASLGDLIAPRDLLGAQLEWQHGDYVVTLYGTNLTDQIYETALNTGTRYAGPPRQFGIRVMKPF